MGFLVAAYTDIGISRASNQDSICVKRGLIGSDEIVMAVVCDGMGGYEKGELASAEIVRFFSGWFDALPVRKVVSEWEDIPLFWCNYLEQLNLKIYEYGRRHDIRIGSTFTGLLLWKQNYILVHIGDSKIFQIGERLTKMTTDHIHPQHKHILTRCIGASSIPEPEIRVGYYEPDTVFLMCSDGFGHRLTGEELCRWFAPQLCLYPGAMRDQCERVVNELEKRGEKDNISVILIKDEGDDSDEITAPGAQEEDSRAFEVLESEIYTHTEERIPVWETGEKRGKTV